MKIKLIIISLLLVFSIKTEAQNYTHYNLYSQNNYLYNPASTGENPWLTAFLNTHLQWVGFDGAPRVNTFGIHSPVNKNMGLGLNVSQSSYSIINNLDAKLSYSYRLKFAKDNFLSFGISAGVINNSVAFSDAANYDASDNNQVDSDFKKTGFAAGAGILYNFKNMELQVSLPQLYQLENTNLYTVASVAFDFLPEDPTWDFKPSVMMKVHENSPAQFDINMTGMWNKTVWANLALRTNNSFVVGAGLNYKNIGLGYALEINSSPMNKMANGTHEIQLMVHFGKNFVKTKILNEAVEVQTSKKTMIIGTVKDKDGNPVENANVVVFDDNKQVVQTKTDKDGKFNFELEPSKKYKVVTTADDCMKEESRLKVKRKSKSVELDINIKRIKAGDLIKLGNIEFETGTSNLTPDSYNTLDSLVKIMKNNPSVKIEISGHTDDVGSEATNKSVSEKRAKTCSDYIISKGILADRIKTIGYGETKPLVPNDSKENKAKNRRVEFKIIK